MVAVVVTTLFSSVMKWYAIPPEGRLSSCFALILLQCKTEGESLAKSNTDSFVTHFPWPLKQAFDPAGMSRLGRGRLHCVPRNG
eukprot:3110064-Rhodomonas_salina.2